MKELEEAITDLIDGIDWGAELGSDVVLDDIEISAYESIEVIDARRYLEMSDLFPTETPLDHLRIVIENLPGDEALDEVRERIDKGMDTHKALISKAIRDAFTERDKAWETRLADAIADATDAVTPTSIAADLADLIRARDAALAECDRLRQEGAALRAELAARPTPRAARAKFVAVSDETITTAQIESLRGDHPDMVAIILGETSVCLLPATRKYMTQQLVETYNRKHTPKRRRKQA